ncbi:putative F-box domain-containing protein [Tanacetum coccineum]
MVLKQKMQADYMPLEIQEEIMKRLPIKSLIRFISVSKPWKSLIRSSKFIANYRVQKSCLLVSYGDTEDEYYTNTKYLSIADDVTFPQRKLDLTLPMSLNTHRQLFNIGSSHGLLCISYGNMVVLWNPTIKKTVSIYVHDVLNNLPYETIYGFGFCPDTYDPKLVKSIFNQKLGESHTVEVYTLSSRVWRSPHSNLPRKSVCFTHSRVNIDGRIYWLAYDYLRLPDGLFEHSLMIMSFAMTSEEFLEIPFPDSLATKGAKGDIAWDISKIRESLVVIEIDLKVQVYGLWIMMNHCDPNSFTKLYNINLADASITRVSGFRYSGEAIVKIKNDDKNALYVNEPNSKHISSIGISHSYLVGYYTETLLLLDH